MLGNHFRHLCTRIWEWRRWDEKAFGEIKEWKYCYCDWSLVRMQQDLIWQNLVMDHCGGKGKRDVSSNFQRPSAVTGWIIVPLTELAKTRERFTQEDEVVSLGYVLLCLFAHCLVGCLPIFFLFLFSMLFFFLFFFSF